MMMAQSESKFNSKSEGETVWRPKEVCVYVFTEVFSNTLPIKKPIMAPGNRKIK